MISEKPFEKEPGLKTTLQQQSKNITDFFKSKIGETVSEIQEHLEGQDSVEVLKRVFLIGIGATVMTTEKLGQKIKELVDDMVEKGYIHPKEASHTLSTLKSKFSTLTQEFIDSPQTIKKGLHKMVQATKTAPKPAAKKPASKPAAKKAAPKAAAKPAAKKASPTKAAAKPAAKKAAPKAAAKPAAKKAAPKAAAKPAAKKAAPKAAATKPLGSKALPNKSTSGIAMKPKAKGKRA